MQEGCDNFLPYLGRRGNLARTTWGALTDVPAAALTAEEVHQAMTARGFRGDAKTLEYHRPGAIDAYYVLAVVVLAAAILMGDIFLGR